MPTTIEAYNGIWFISSAINTKIKTVYSQEERFNQTLETIESIDKYCPRNLKILHDSSVDMPDEKYLRELGARGVQVFYTGNDPGIQELTAHHATSAAELRSTTGVINWFNQELRGTVTALRVYKISGRYKLNDNFILEDERFDNAFVVNPIVDSYMPKERQELTGAYKAHGTRLVHWDFRLMDVYADALPKMLADCINLGIDAEHAYWKHLHTNKIVEVPKIGVEGWIAPLGKYEDD
jgi:hypothetical protein